MQVVCGLFHKITTALLNSNDVCNGDIVVMYYTPGHSCPGCVVHHYSQFYGKSFWSKAIARTNLKSDIVQAIGQANLKSDSTSDCTI